MKTLNIHKKIGISIWIVTVLITFIIPLIFCDLSNVPVSFCPGIFAGCLLGGVFYLIGMENN
jgi:hypothetical protein